MEPTTEATATLRTPQELFKEGTRLMNELNFTREQVLERFISEGVDQRTATNVVNGLGRPPVTSDDIPDTLAEKSGSRSGQRDMIVGALWCLGGILVTAFTYQSASGGGRYVVAYGAIIFGAIQFFRGAMAGK